MSTFADIVKVRVFNAPGQGVDWEIFFARKEGACSRNGAKSPDLQLALQEPQDEQLPSGFSQDKQPHAPPPDPVLTFIGWISNGVEHTPARAAEIDTEGDAWQAFLLNRVKLTTIASSVTIHLDVTVKMSVPFSEFHEPVPPNIMLELAL